jgi:ferredoxin-NADP reductase
MLLKLTNIKPETGDIVTFIFQPREPLDWRPGQFFLYTMRHPNMDDRHDTRWFTNSAAPFEKHVQITTRFSPRSSSFKKALKQLPIGADIEAEGPDGEFVVTDPNRTYIFVAGGIGITPFRSILAEADHNGLQLNAHLIYANSDNHILFKDELYGFAQRNTQLGIELLTEPTRLTLSHLSHTIESSDNPYVYISGPEPMVEATTVIAKKLGVSGDHIQTDFFPGYATI